MTAKRETPPKARPGGRSERVSKAVQQATTGILVERGAAELTLEAVAVKAGVNRATLYRRWGDKMRLITWALLETVGEEVPYSDKGSLKADLSVVLNGVNDFLGTPLARAVLQIMTQPVTRNDDVNQALNAFWNSRTKRMDELFARAARRGELPARADRDYIVDQLFGPIYLQHIMRREAVPQSYITRLIDDVVSRLDAL